MKTLLSQRTLEACIEAGADVKRMQRLYGVTDNRVLLLEDAKWLLNNVDLLVSEVVKVEEGLWYSHLPDD